MKDNSTLYLCISSIILAIALAYQSHLIRTKYNINQYKCPESSTHVQSSSINITTGVVSCTYYPPTRKSTTK